MYTVAEPSMSVRQFCDAIYDGEIVLFRQPDTVCALVEFTRAFCERALNPSHPTANHTDKRSLEGLADLHRRYTRDEQAKQHWRTVFEDIGFDAACIAVDRLFLRFQTPQTHTRHRVNVRTGPLPHHRDTWGSNLYSQVNWWAPVYPVTADNSMALYPAYWTRKTENTSRDYDLPCVIRRNREKGLQAVKPDEVVPILRQSVDERKAQPVLVQPGDLIAFSGAHLHASIPNASAVTRVSLETRTILIEDTLAARGAPNIDGHSRWMAPGWFRRLCDQERLSSLLQVEPVCPYPLAR